MEKPDCDAHRRAVAGDRDRAEGRRPQPALDRRHRHRDRRLPAAALRARRASRSAAQCGREIAAQTVQQVVDRLRRAAGGDAALDLYAPVVRDRKGEHRKELEELRRGGLRPRARRRRAARARRRHRRSRDDRAAHDRGAGRPPRRAAGVERRLADSLEVAFRARRRHRAGRGVGAGRRRAAAAALQPAPRVPGVRRLVSRSSSPRFFSFNSPHGACPGVRRLGVRAPASIPALVVRDARRSRVPAPSRRSSQRALPGLDESLRGARGALPVPARHAVRGLPDADPRRRSCTARASEDDRRAGRTRRGAPSRPFEGVIPLLERRSARDAHRRGCATSSRASSPRARCPDCDGTRLRREARFVRVGRPEHRRGLGAARSRDARRLLRRWRSARRRRRSRAPILKEICGRGSASCSTSGSTT